MARLGGRPLTLCLGLLVTACVATAKPPPPPWTAACDATESATTLWPAPVPAPVPAVVPAVVSAVVPAVAASAATPEAHAVWLTRHLIRWPGAGTEGRFRLHRSLRGQLLATPGERVRGSDGALTLQAHSGELPEAAAGRFKSPASGLLLSVSTADAASLPLWLREQLLLVREDDQGRVLQVTGLRVAGALDDLYAAAVALPDLGVTFGPGRATNFRLWAPTAQRVSLCLHPGGSQPRVTRIPLQRDAATGAWALRINADLSGGQYTYIVEKALRGGGVTRYRVSDPYAISVSGDSRRSSIANLDAPALKPPGWDTSPVPRRTEAATDKVFYELHARNFSINDLTVSPPRRGNPGAFAETGSDSMKHLLALASAGLTDVVLEPAPELTSAADGERPGGAEDGVRRIVELRQMVMALHSAGLRVSMRGACGPAAALGGDGMRALGRVVPDYSDPMSAGGAVDATSCGKLSDDAPLMQTKLLADLRLRWARDFRVDTASVPLGDDGARRSARRTYIIGANEARNEARNEATNEAKNEGKGKGKGEGAKEGAQAGPTALAPGKARAEAPLRMADWVRAGLAGSLRGYVMTTWRDELLPLSKIDHAGQPAGDAGEPGEVVNRAGNHDPRAALLPPAASAEDLARAQHLDAAIVAFSQGIAFFHAGGAGPSGKPPTAEMRWAGEAFADLLKIRASSTLFRLRTAAEVQARLLFHNTGSVQVPTVLVGHLDGVGQPGAVFRDIVYLVNVDQVAQTVAVEPLKDRPFELHPDHAGAGAADRRASTATFERASGSFTVPPRTAVVFVVR